MSDEQPAPRDEWVVAPYRVIYGDTDAMGVVYYGNYLRFLEMARSEYLRARGGDYRLIEEQGYALPVAEVTLRYSSPARYEDLLHVAVRCCELQRVSLRFEYRITQADGGALVAKGSTRHAWIKRDSGRPCRMPAMAADWLPPLSG